jgi:hypothetical protein
MSGPPQEDSRQHQKDEKGEDLEGQAGEEDVIRCGRVFPVRFRLANQSCAGDLHACGDDIADDEYDEDEARRERCELAAQPIDEDGEDGVYSGGEENRRYYDEEVLYNKVYDVVGVDFWACINSSSSFGPLGEDGCIRELSILNT